MAIGNHKDHLDFKWGYGFTIEDLEIMRGEIDESLCYDKNYNGIDFCDVSSGCDVSGRYVLVRLFHRDIKGYCCWSFCLNYDFSNRKEVVEAITKKWKGYTKKDLEDYKRFIEQGERWGWD